MPSGFFVRLNFQTDCPGAEPTASSGLSWLSPGTPSCPKSMAAASAPKTPTGFEIAARWQHLGDPLLTRLN